MSLHATLAVLGVLFLALPTLPVHEAERRLCDDRLACWRSRTPPATASA
jgi:hypothetical protein